MGTDTDRSVTYEFLLTLHSNQRPISYHFRDKRQFQSKIANFPHPGVFDLSTEGVSLGIGYSHSGSKKLEWWGYRTEKEARQYLQRYEYNAAT